MRTKSDVKKHTGKNKENEITAIDYITYKNGIHFQIAYGEGSDWYEAVSGVFGFGYDPNSHEGSEETIADSN